MLTIVLKFVQVAVNLVINNNKQSIDVLIQVGNA